MASAIPVEPPTPTVVIVPLAPTATLTPLSAEQRDELFNEVWTLVRDRYVYDDFRGLDWDSAYEEFAPRIAAADSTETFYSLMREMIARLDDDHSRFESPQEVAESEARFEDSLAYGGIGAIVRTIDEGGLIVSIAADGPADSAGLQSRDVIVSVNGTPFTNTQAFGPEGPIGAVRGIPGTTVRLTVRSPDEPPRDVEIIRQTIPGSAFPRVEVQRLPGVAVGLLTINTFFVEDIDQLVRDQMESLLQKGPLDGLVIDVRINSGGRIDLMLNTLGLFADGGSIGATYSRQASSKLTVPENQTLPQLADVPIIVLISDETISAAEMFSAGMRELGRARLVGTPSAGNTENLYPHDFDDGSRLWLAELTYHLPDGELIEDQGVIPDILIEADWWLFDPADDPYIQAAVGALTL